MKEKAMKTVSRILLSLALVLTFAMLHPTNANAAITTVTQTSDSESTVKVEWSPVSGAAGYSVYLYDGSNKLIDQDDGTSSFFTSNTFRNLGAGSSYYVVVEAWGTYSYSAHSNSLGSSEKLEVVTSPDLPSKTTYQVTDMGDNTCTLSYASVPGTTKYKAEYNPANDSKKKIYAYSDSTKMTISGLKKNTEYYCYVYATRVSASGYEALSSSYMRIDDSKVNNYTISALPTVVGDFIPNFYVSTKKIGVEMSEKSPAANGFRYTIYDGKKKLKTYDTTYRYDSFKASYVTKNKLYKVVINTYRYDTAGKKHYSKAKTAYGSKSVDTTKLSSKNKSVTVKWKKISGMGKADRYVVYAAKGSVNFTKCKKVATVKGNKSSASFSKLSGKKLKSGQGYSVYVVAQKKINKKWVTVSDSSLFYGKHDIKVK